MALPLIFKTLLEGAASDVVLKGVKAVVERMPWARDRRKLEHVERKIHILVDSASDLARNLAPQAVEAQMERLLSGFQQDLEQEGISAEDAKLVRESVRAQIRTTVLQPLQDLVRVQSRLDALESDSVSLARRLDEAESALSAGRAGAERLARLVWIEAVALAVSVVLAVTGFLLAALAVTRR